MSYNSPMYVAKEFRLLIEQLAGESGLKKSQVTKLIADRVRRGDLKLELPLTKKSLKGFLK